MTPISLGIKYELLWLLQVLLSPIASFLDPLEPHKLWLLDYIYSGSTVQREKLLCLPLCPDQKSDQEKVLWFSNYGQFSEVNLKRVTQLLRMKKMGVYGLSLLVN